MTRKIGAIGDINPIDHGGGYVLTAPKMNGPWVEYFYGLELYFDKTWDLDMESKKTLNHEVCIYRVDLAKSPTEFLSDVDWVDWDKVGNSCGWPSEEVARIVKPGNLKSAQSRANLLQDAAGYYGWHEFDHYALRLTLGELIKRWSRY